MQRVGSAPSAALFRQCATAAVTAGQEPEKSRQPSLDRNTRHISSVLSKTARKYMNSFIFRHLRAIHTGGHSNVNRQLQKLKC